MTAAGPPLSPAPREGPSSSHHYARVFFGPGALVVALLSMIGFAACYGFPANFDSWWHLPNGRYMVATHHLPTPDPYSFTAAGRAWVPHEWLAELAMYALYRPL